MKKITLILALIFLISLGSVFAEKANLPTVWMWSQANAIIASDSDTSIMATGWGPQAYYSAGIYWSNDVSGADISFQGNGYQLPTELRQFSAYYMFMDGMIKTTVGKVRDGDYRFTDYINADGMMSRLTGSSIEVKVSPVEGFNFTAQLPVGSDANGAPGDSNDALSSMGFGASYVVPNVAKFIASTKLNAVSGDDYDYFYVAADVSAVENLGLRLIFQNEPHNNHIGIAAKYGMDAITLAEEIYADFPEVGDSTYSSETGVYYAMGSVVPGLEFTLANDGTDTDITVYPNVAFNFGGSQLEVGVSIDSVSSTTTWAIPVQAIFTF